MTGLRYIKVLLPLRLKWEPFYYVDGSAEAWEAGPPDTGDRVRVEFAGKEYVGVVTQAQAGDEAAKVGLSRIKPTTGPAKGLPRITEAELSLWRQVADYYLCSVGEVYKAAYPAGKVEEEEVKARVAAKLRDRLARVEEKIGKARKDETRKRYTKEREIILEKLGQPGTPTPSCMSGQSQDSPATGIELSAAQTAAYSRIKEIFNEGKPALLEGVTGSGKTEIYLKLARETLDSGRNVLFLVPEIALSRQLEERITRLFPQECQVFHSAETLSRRIEAARFVRSRPYLVLGTRSSVFLPHRDLGLVIVDEEHDPSYKQDNPAPRYNGREAAIMLGRIFGAGIILGSATPSLESLYNCSVGRFALVELKERYYSAPDSDVLIIDTIAERKKNGMTGHFSRKLTALIGSTLASGGQVAILRERRALAPMVQCEECGHIPKCRNCDVALSLHRRPDGTRKLVCHYCGRVYEYSGTCPSCGGELRAIGSGTQQIEDEAKVLFPEARVARLDSDNARSRASEAGIIRSFAEGSTDILVGTSIVAKGFDFSGLSLVAVLQADSLLGQQDYRADERSLQLLEQFRGRCGRRADKGLFVIQTAQPDHPVYKRITGESDREDSLRKFLSERKLFGYPPYSRVINAILKDSNLARIALMGKDFAASLSNSGLASSAKVIGPYSPTVDKVAGQHIRIVRILLPKDRFLRANKQAVNEAVECFEKERKYSGHISLDVDPV